MPHGAPNSRKRNSTSPGRRAPNRPSPGATTTVTSRVPTLASVAGNRCFLPRTSSSPAPAGRASPGRWPKRRLRPWRIRRSSRPGRRFSARAATPISATSSPTAPGPRASASASIRRPSSSNRKRTDPASPRGVRHEYRRLLVNPSSSTPGPWTGTVVGVLVWMLADGGPEGRSIVVKGKFPAGFASLHECRMLRPCHIAFVSSALRPCLPRLKRCKLP